MVMIYQIPPSILSLILENAHIEYLILNLWQCGNKQLNNTIRCGTRSLSVIIHNGKICNPSAISELAKLKHLEVRNETDAKKLNANFGASYGNKEDLPPSSAYNYKDLDLISRSVRQNIESLSLIDGYHLKKTRHLCETPLLGHICVQFPYIRSLTTVLYTYRHFSIATCLLPLTLTQLNWSTGVINLRQKWQNVLPPNLTSLTVNKVIKYGTVFAESAPPCLTFMSFAYGRGVRDDSTIDMEKSSDEQTEKRISKWMPPSVVSYNLRKTSFVVKFNNPNCADYQYLVDRKDRREAIVERLDIGFMPAFTEHFDAKYFGEVVVPYFNLSNVVKLKLSIYDQSNSEGINLSSMVSVKKLHFDSDCFNISCNFLSNGLPPNLTALKCNLSDPFQQFPQKPEVDLAKLPPSLTKINLCVGGYITLYGVSHPNLSIIDIKAAYHVNVRSPLVLPRQLRDFGFHSLCDHLSLALSLLSNLVHVSIYECNPARLSFLPSTVTKLHVHEFKYVEEELKSYVLPPNIVDLSVFHVIAAAGMYNPFYFSKSLKRLGLESISEVLPIEMVENIPFGLDYLALCVKCYKESDIDNIIDKLYARSKSVDLLGLDGKRK